MRDRRTAERVFAYGTLQDERRLQRVLGGGWRGLGSGTIRGALYNVGRYPALILALRGAGETAPTGEPQHVFTRVPGLVIELEDGRAALARLDAYEGVAEGLYERRRCRITLTGGDRVAAWVYVYCRSVRGLRRIDAWPPSA